MADETFGPYTNPSLPTSASCGEGESSTEIPQSTTSQVIATPSTDQSESFHFPLGKPGPFQIIESGSGICSGGNSRASHTSRPAPCGSRERLKAVDLNESSFEIPSLPNHATELRPSNEPPRRRYSCPNYNTCLDLAAALNWDSFTCRGCSGQIDEALLWRARQALKRDEVARTVCELPEIQLHSAASPASPAGNGLKLISKA